ncbi:MAG TPA: glycosyltransferase family 4 protein, partial [Thermomicrobiales bacterium]|nr:glycosyltransferase family 4 protein [Thermomicrobiales bacterium]
MVRRVLVLAGDTVPLPGLPVHGGGLRGWSLARGLEAAGCAVTLLFPRQALDDLGAAVAPAAREAALPHTFAWHEVAAAVAAQAPDCVVCCSWALAAELGPCPAPLAVDVAGPVLLEFLYQDEAKALALAQRKPLGLGHADFVTCAGERQRAYFYPWLLLAGFAPDDLRDRVAVVPISTAPPSTYEPRHNAEPRLVCAGLAVAWQNPALPLAVAGETLARRGRGRLDVYAVEHPVHSRGATWVDALRARVAGNERVAIHAGAPLPYADLLAVYRRADLAIDLFARNAERELAFNTRTVDYLAAGLPVLYGDYAELAGPLAAYGAGLLVAPDDPAAIAAALERALDDPAHLAALGANARRLVDERLTWDRTITPLAAWCAAPTRRAPGPLSPASLVLDLVRRAEFLEGRNAELAGQAEERGAYAARVERAWAEQGARLADLDAALARRRAAPWRAALRQTLAAARARLGGKRAG